MSVDILGTNCDQCRSMVQCCFTSTETVRLIRTESPGRPPPELFFTSTVTVGLLGTGAQDGHLDFHTAPELCFTSTETVGLLGTGAQDGHPDFHTAPELCRFLWK